MAYPSASLSNPITPLRLDPNGSSPNFKEWSYGCSLTITLAMPPSTYSPPKQLFQMSSSHGFDKPKIISALQSTHS
ncbi:hypothetical protein CLOP_g15123 [Closterium sp. NIES-67]|nr:hypothetical protein CLOP_g15123 [Closterium sp. NIES-67]